MEKRAWVVGLAGAVLLLGAALVGAVLRLMSGRKPAAGEARPNSDTGHDEVVRDRVRRFVGD
jgi:hypothetical protein